MTQKRKSESGAAINPSLGNMGNGNAAMRPRNRTPRPLNLHLFTTATMLSAAALPLVTDPAARQKVLDLVASMTGHMMQGLEAYRASGASAQRRMHQTIWSDGSTRLLRTSTNAPKNAVPVLLVPSLINRYDILDLDAQHSFVSYLEGQGFDPCILDWGAPTESEKDFTIDDYIARRLYPALAQLNRPHMVGYCMGGTMAAGAVAALADQSNIRSLTLLAAPWDFHAGDQTMALRINAFATAVEPVLQHGTLPVDWIQALFASIDPLFAFNKFRAFAGMDPASDEARRFVIVEDWLNDGVDLTAPSARQALQQWYIDNQPFNAVWTIGNRLVDAANIKVPVLVVAAGGDRLVPAPSALAIMQQIAAAESMTPDIGHIGLMASPRANKGVWEPIARWLATR
jgi:polyhydroxyalkanoate synthase